MAAHDEATGEREGGGHPADGAVQVAKQDGGEQATHDPRERRAGKATRSHTEGICCDFEPGTSDHSATTMILRSCDLCHLIP